MRWKRAKLSAKEKLSNPITRKRMYRWLTFGEIAISVAVIILAIINLMSKDDKS